ncbi:hypothetical protein RJ639_004387 [Escallonia herrerae]|uniref:Pectinesterase inhibitor domain-containing protein n=1 Tax=Escallonia herrerae TaxID=1293975 RepID=A0AA89B2F7_9ASTE|nr:hypothetical protein RJ639_004387 [Escallonia herrerae]
MAQVSLSLLLLAIFCLAGSVKSAVHPGSRARAIVVAQCRSTRFPALCVHCLSNYVNTTVQSPQQLAQVALTVSLIKARYTRAYVAEVAKQFSQTKGRDYQAVKDCLDRISDGVDQITQSIKEIQRMGRDGDGEFGWHVSNVNSWTSAALSDTMVCIDGFSGQAVGGKVKATIKAKVLNVAQVTSNALAIFNRFAARHRASGATHKP